MIWVPPEIKINQGRELPDWSKFLFRFGQSLATIENKTFIVLLILPSRSFAPWFLGMGFYGERLIGSLARQDEPSKNRLEELRSVSPKTQAKMIWKGKVKDGVILNTRESTKFKFTEKRAKRKRNREEYQSHFEIHLNESNVRKLRLDSNEESEITAPRVCFSANREFAKHLYGIRSPEWLFPLNECRFRIYGNKKQLEKELSLKVSVPGKQDFVQGNLADVFGLTGPQGGIRSDDVIQSGSYRNNNGQTTFKSSELVIFDGALPVIRLGSNLRNTSTVFIIDCHDPYLEEALDAYHEHYQYSKDLDLNKFPTPITGVEYSAIHR